MEQIYLLQRYVSDPDRDLVLVETVQAAKTRRALMRYCADRRIRYHRESDFIDVKAAEFGAVCHVIEPTSLLHGDSA